MNVEPRRVAGITPIDRDEMVDVTRMEYQRLLGLLRDLSSAEWSHATDCEAWDVRQLVAHLLGAAEGNARFREFVHQYRLGLPRARRDGGEVVDGVNAVQVEERDHLTPAELIERLTSVYPAAIRGRRRVPGPFRRIPLDAGEGLRITLGELMDITYTRDVWLHRVDIARAVGRDLVLTGDHDARIVADVVRDWAGRHGQPFELVLTGPAGGRYVSGDGGPELQLDAVEFCRMLSGRADGEGLLDVPVLF